MKKKIVKPAARRGSKIKAGKTNKQPLKKVTAKTTRKRVGKLAARSKLKVSARKASVAKTKAGAKHPARSVQKVDSRPIIDLLPETRSELRPIREMVKRNVPRSVTVKPKTKANIRRPQPAAMDADTRRALRMPQFTYMKPPGTGHAYEVGNTVEVFCDHDKNNDRIRGWVKGIVVQVDNKLVAVQFRSNVYLTDGWMVPDHILWYPVTSDQIRSETTSKKSGKKNIPEY
jgi:hypothetical protein